MMKQTAEYILKNIEIPSFSTDRKPIMLSEGTMIERRKKVVSLMHKRGLDCIVVYADLEHGSNFEYLTGFLPRFEEGMIVFHKNEKTYLLLGNENTKMVNYSRIPASLIHVPYLSLPNQPMMDDAKLSTFFQQADIRDGMNVGLVGWKHFTSMKTNNRKLFDVPHFLVQALQDIVKDNIENHCDMFIGEGGARTQNNANEIAHYEVASAMASDAVLNGLNKVEIGKSEIEIASLMNPFGQRNSVVTICATGDRFAYANLYPSDKKVQLGDKMSITVGFKGGLSSRAGYAVHNEQELPTQVQDYIPKIAAPYYGAIATWLEEIHIGMSGSELYNTIETVLPKSDYHWSLNPGHLCADEEWMSSPIYPDSTQTILSGMILQTDIIPSMPGYGGVSCESGIALADENLRQQIQQEYPQLWETFQKRRDFMINTLGIKLHDEVLPMNDTVAYYRPFFLNKKLAFVKSSD